jgi:hypothetical protein
MNVLKVKRSQQVFLAVGKIRLFLDGEDLGELSQGEVKKIETEKNAVVLRFENSMKNLEMKVNLKENCSIEMFWDRFWGNIGYKDPDKIVTSRKREINWKNYIMLLVIFFIAGFVLARLYING